MSLFSLALLRFSFFHSLIIMCFGVLPLCLSSFFAWSSLYSGIFVVIAFAAIFLCTFCVFLIKFGKINHSFFFPQYFFSPHTFLLLWNFDNTHFRLFNIVSHITEVLFICYCCWGFFVCFYVYLVWIVLFTIVSDSTFSFVVY